MAWDNSQQMERNLRRRNHKLRELTAKTTVGEDYLAAVIKLRHAAAGAVGILNCQVFAQWPTCAETAKELRDAMDAEEKARTKMVVGR